MTAAPTVPISWGELLDKMTILEIKAERLTAPAARDNARHELGLLRQIAEPVLHGQVGALAGQLKDLNLALWEIEDRIRLKEAVKEFDAAFIELARAVYHRNDERGALKREINLALGSDLIEEKSYQPY